MIENKFFRSPDRGVSYNKCGFSYASLSSLTFLQNCYIQVLYINDYETIETSPITFGNNFFSYVRADGWLTLCYLYKIPPVHRSHIIISQLFEDFDYIKNYLYFLEINTWINSTMVKGLKDKGVRIAGCGIIGRYSSMSNLDYSHACKTIKEEYPEVTIVERTRICGN